jgi:hypothetical protein
VRLSQEITLTEEHIKILQGRVSKFREAQPSLRQKMIQDAADTINRTRMAEEEFDRETLIDVREI